MLVSAVVIWACGGALPTSLVEAVSALSEVWQVSGDEVVLIIFHINITITLKKVRPSNEKQLLS